MVIKPHRDCAASHRLRTVRTLSEQRNRRPWRRDAEPTVFKPEAIPDDRRNPRPSWQTTLSIVALFAAAPFVALSLVRLRLRSRARGQLWYTNWKSYVELAAWSLLTALYYWRFSPVTIVIQALR